MAGIWIAVAVAGLGLFPGVPGARWLLALGSLALAPLLLMLGGSQPRAGRSSARWRIAVGLFAGLLGAGAAMLLAGAKVGWLGWPFAAWSALAAFWLLPLLILGLAARTILPTGSPEESDEDPEAGDAAR